MQIIRVACEWAAMGGSWAATKNDGIPTRGPRPSIVTLVYTRWARIVSLFVSYGHKKFELFKNSKLLVRLPLPSQAASLLEGP